MNKGSLAQTIRSLIVFLICLSTLFVWPFIAFAFSFALAPVVHVIGQLRIDNFLVCVIIKIENFLFFAPQMAFAYDEVFTRVSYETVRWTGACLRTFPAFVASIIPWLLWPNVALLFTFGTRRIHKLRYLIPLAFGTIVLVIIASQALISLSGNVMILDGP